MNEIKESIQKYYLEQGCNCAESILHAADEAWNLGLGAETFRAIGPFGGGICCGDTCGALAGAVAAIGIKYIDTQMHASPAAREKTRQFVEAFQSRFGSCVCRELKDRYARDDRRCLALVEQTAELLEEF